MGQDEDISRETLPGEEPLEVPEAKEASELTYVVLDFSSM
jgi:hypothetical protein